MSWKYFKPISLSRIRVALEQMKLLVNGTNVLKKHFVVNGNVIYLLYMYFENVRRKSPLLWLAVIFITDDSFV